MRLISYRARLLALVGAVLLAGGVAGAEDRVYPSPDEVEPLAVGSRVPSSSVETVLGASVDLAEVVRDRGALLVFYRGGW